MYREMQEHLYKMLEVMKNIGYSESVVDHYRHYVLAFIEFLHENELDLSEKSLSQYSNWLDSLDLLNNNQLRARKSASNRFLLFFETGYFTRRAPIQRHKIDGNFSTEVNDFIESLYKLNLKNVTISQYSYRLRQFISYLDNNSFTEITSDSVERFFEYFSSFGPSSFAFYSCSTYIRKFLKFCYENHYLSEEISLYVPHGRYIRNQRLPSVYTDEEIKAVLRSIERNSAVGKRDYAMVMILVCFGLRAHDVVSLKFSDIDWENSIINLTMDKTGKDIQLPLFPDIGNAIIDWLKHGYRESDLPYIFQPVKGPITALTSGALYSVVNKYLHKAGINTENRHHGTHSLRHSLATRLLEQGESLPVISEVLGHSDTQVTTVYTAVDIKSLRDCALQVPPLKSRIYAEA